MESSPLSIPRAPNMKFKRHPVINRKGRYMCIFTHDVLQGRVCEGGSAEKKARLGEGGGQEVPETRARWVIEI